MAGHQILGVGVDTDIISGRPKPVKSQEERLAEVKLKEQEAIHEASQLIQELNTSPVLALLAQQLERRMVVLTQADPESQGILKIIANLNRKFTAPYLARKLVRQIMGPQLCSFLEETEAAPE